MAGYDNGHGYRLTVQIADTVAVAVLERSHVDLINDFGLPPVRFERVAQSAVDQLGRHRAAAERQQPQERRGLSRHGFTYVANVMLAERCGYAVPPGNGNVNQNAPTIYAFPLEIMVVTFKSNRRNNN